MAQLPQSFIQSRTLQQPLASPALNQPTALGSLQANRSLGLSNQSTASALNTLFNTQPLSTQGLSNQGLSQGLGLSNQFARSPGLQQQQFLPASQGLSPFEDQGILDYNVVTSPSRITPASLNVAGRSNVLSPRGLGSQGIGSRSLGLGQASPPRSLGSQQGLSLGRTNTPGSPITTAGMRSPTSSVSPAVQSMNQILSNEGIGPASGVQISNIPGPTSGPILSQPSVAADGTVVVSVTEVVNPTNPVTGSPQASETIGEILLDANRTIAQTPADPNRRTPAQETVAQSSAALAQAAITTAAEMNFNTRTNPPPRNLVNPMVYSPSRVMGVEQTAFRVQVPSVLPSPARQVEMNRQRTNAIGVSPREVQTPGQLRTQILNEAARRGGGVVSTPTLLYSDQANIVFGSRNPPGIETLNAINMQRISEGLAPVRIVSVSPARSPQRRVKEVEDTYKIGDATYTLNSRSGSLVSRIAHDEMLKANPIPQPRRDDNAVERMLQAARTNAYNAARSPLGQVEAARRIESIRSAQVLANAGLSPTRSTPRRQTPSQAFRPI